MSEGKEKEKVTLANATARLNGLVGYMNEAVERSNTLAAKFNRDPMPDKTSKEDASISGDYPSAILSLCDSIEKKISDILTNINNVIGKIE